MPHTGVIMDVLDELDQIKDAEIKAQKYFCYISLAQIFHVSTDYLLDISANKTINLDKYSDNEQELVFRMLQYFDETGTQIHNNSKS